MSSAFHTPVMVNEVLDFLITSPSGNYIDATVGGGGHAEAILDKLASGGRLVCFDRDPDALTEARERLSRWEKQIILVEDIFSRLNEHLEKLSITKVDGILFDLGVSSFQIDAVERGFTYQQNAPLDMRMDKRAKVNAATIINTFSEKELADILFNYGEERNARKIARSIVNARKKNEITTSEQLVDSIRRVVGERFLVKTLSRVFQALRITVNQELEILKDALEQTVDLLQPGGRLVVISYHSLEDRIVKEFMRRESSQYIRSDDPFRKGDIRIVPRLKILTKKPVEASEDERRLNPRSRSAKLRAAEKLTG